MKRILVFRFLSELCVLCGLLFIFSCHSPTPAPIPGSCAVTAQAPRGYIVHHGRSYRLHQKIHIPHVVHPKFLALQAVNNPPNFYGNLPWLAAAYDQSNGDCTANATVRDTQFAIAKTYGENLAVMQSRRFEWWITRNYEGNDATNQDVGCSVADSIATVQSIGSIPESEMPYSTPYTTAPTSQQLADAARIRAVSPQQISLATPSDLEAWIAGGRIASVGIQVYQSFESDAVATTGEVPTPCPLTENYLGGHDVDVVAYDTAHVCLDGTTGAVMIVNSWGDDWGMQPTGAVSRGFAWLGFSYVFNPRLASDCHGFATVQMQ